MGLGKRLSFACAVAVAGCASIAHRQPAVAASSPAMSSSWATTSYDQQRLRMATRIRDDVMAAAPAAATPAFERTLAAVASVPREAFVRPAGKRFAYVSLPQEIGYGQTISDPYIVTIMTAALDVGRGANVLDIGTGSGYQAAVLSLLADRVWSVEIVAPLARMAASRLRRMGYRNITVRTGDGFAGWLEHAPFDGIIVAAGAKRVPQALIDQLRIGGRLVMPIGASTASEQLEVVTKQANGRVDRCSLGRAMFVPLTGRGYAPERRGALLDRSVPLCFGVPIS